MSSNTSYYRSPFGDTTFTKVFVGGLAWETPTEEMRRYFDQFGEILEAVIIMDKTTGKSKGYGFVTFRESDSATRAVADPNPVIDGRKANCNIASFGRPRLSTPRDYSLMAQGENKEEALVSIKAGDNQAIPEWLLRCSRLRLPSSCIRRTGTTSDDFLTNTEKRHSDELPTILRCGHTRPEFIGKAMYRRRTFLGQFRRSGFLGIFRRTLGVGIYRRTLVRRNIPTDICSSVYSDGYWFVGKFRRMLVRRKLLTALRRLSRRNSRM
uniref:RRM domain-containing protein n=1 Tax=Brassica oleracea TaxID=3712 RepID=A0A3P6FGB9_BRAOL|nr:unnamed protein product [Brassica oleracea]